ncbi:MAG: tRNA-uridine aminocarboxypropyltransferase [Bdellovibrionales bacterium]
MNLELYLEKKRQLALQPPSRPMRLLCMTCLQPQMMCYCRHVRRFDPRIKFVILIHRLEVRRRIATGRLSYLSMENSELMMGYDYSKNQRLTEIVKDPANYPVILYPGPKSLNLTPMSGDERAQVFPAGKQPVVIVIDGTWGTAGKMLSRSENLQGLSRICFTPDRPSNFRVRKQPKKECFSTVEAIHQTIEMVGPGRGFDVAGGSHHALLSVFDVMVEQQLEFVRLSRLESRQSRHRRIPLSELMALT